MICDAAEFFEHAPSPHIVVTASPQLRQASVRVNTPKDGWKEEVWNLRTITPTRLEVVNPAADGYGNSLNPLQIDRQTGVARFFYTGKSADVENLTNCVFKTL